VSLTFAVVPHDTVPAPKRSKSKPLFTWKERASEGKEADAQRFDNDEAILGILERNLALRLGPNKLHVSAEA
jgi:hypothetical protein